MLALDNAMAEELRAAVPDGVPVYYASADRDDPPPYVVHRSTDSRLGSLGLAGISGTEAREYEHSVIAISDDPDQAEALREAIVARLQSRIVDVEGWGPSQKIMWVGEVHDPGDMLPGGALVHFAGDRWKVSIYRSK